MVHSAARLHYDQGIDALQAGRHAEAIAALEQALKTQPGDPSTLFALGEAASALGLHQAAARFFSETLEADPTRHEATIRLARALAALMRHGDAIETLRQALGRDPAQAGLWLALGNTVREAGDTGNAETFYREALRLNPASAEALGNLADLLFDAGNRAEARTLYDHAIRRAPQNAQLRLNRALALLVEGEAEAGWREYEHRLRIPGRVIERRGAPRRWTGAPRNGQSLLVMQEQGVGDQIAFAAFMPQLLKDGPVTLECEPRLQPLLARSFPDATVKGQMIRREGVALHAGYDWAQCERSIELASLPHLCGPRPTLADPFLKPDPQEQARWRDWRASLGSERAIGLAWRSGLKGAARNSQYARLEDWAALASGLDATLVVAQYGATADEIAALERISGRTLAVPPDLDQRDELDRTAAMLSTLDAIVSAPTAVASISGALGVPTFKALHHRSWTSLGEAHEPFAPSVACIMPARAGDWANVFAQILSRLAPA